MAEEGRYFWAPTGGGIEQELELGVGKELVAAVRATLYRLVMLDDPGECHLPVVPNLSDLLAFVMRFVKEHLNDRAGGRLPLDEARRSSLEWTLRAFLRSEAKRQQL